MATNPRVEKIVTGAALMVVIGIGFFVSQAYVLRSAVPAPGWLLTSLDGVSIWPTAVWFYASWYVAPLLLFGTPIDRFRFAARAMIVAFSVSLLGYFALPVSIERVEVAGASLSEWVLNAIYAVDGPVNLFPSFHAASAVIVAVAMSREWRSGVWWGAWVALVSASCVLTGQHYVLDVVAGLLVGLVACGLATERELGRSSKHDKAGRGRDGRQAPRGGRRLHEGQLSRLGVILGIAAGGLQAAGCTAWIPEPRVANMIATTSHREVGHHGVAGATVDGAPRYNRWTAARLEDEPFQQALIQSLQQANAWTSAGRYRLYARIGQRQDDSPGYTSQAMTIRYELRDAVGDAVVWAHFVHSTATLGIGEVWNGLERRCQVVEMAARRNIGQMLERLLPELERRARESDRI